MTGKEEFVKVVKDLFNKNEVPKTAKDYLEWLETNESKKEKKNTELSEKALTVLKYMQDNKDTNLFKCANIAAGIDMSSKSVNGVMRKLISEGYVCKVSDAGVSPVIYSLKN